MQKIVINFFLRALFLKTKLHQKIYHDGSFPFDYYALLSGYVEKYNLKYGLEVGTGIGLTAISSTIFNDGFYLETIEKQKRNVIITKRNIYFFNLLSKLFISKNSNTINSRVKIIEGRMFDYLDTLHKDNNPDLEIVKRKYDYIFLDAYVSRLNEVKRLDNYLEVGGIFIVSNIRGEMKKSHAAKQYLFDKEKFELLELVGDTIFVRKTC